MHLPRSPEESRECAEHDRGCVGDDRGCVTTDPARNKCIPHWFDILLHRFELDPRCSTAATHRYKSADGLIGSDAQSNRTVERCNRSGTGCYRAGTGCYRAGTGCRRTGIGCCRTGIGC